MSLGSSRFEEEALAKLVSEPDPISVRPFTYALTEESVACSTLGRQQESSISYGTMKPHSTVILIWGKRRDVAEPQSSSAVSCP